MQEISGIPFTETKDCRYLITKFMDLATNLYNITRLNISQIKLIHKILKKLTAPIIVLFTRKIERLKFYNQQHKVKGLTNLQLSTQEGVEEGGDQEVILNTDQPQANYIYISESLTQENPRLLKETRIKSKVKKYKHKGYTYNDQVCTQETYTSGIIVITCMKDLKKIVL